MKLYELTDTMARFLAAVEAGEIPEEAIEDTLESIKMPSICKSSKGWPVWII